LETELLEQPAALLLHIARNESKVARAAESPVPCDAVAQSFAGPSKAVVGSRSIETHRIEAV